MNDYETLRNDIAEFLAIDLMGPYHGEDEVLGEPPVSRYLTGILFPQDSVFEKEKRERDDGGVGQESHTPEDDTEEGLALSNISYPSCFGMSFACHKDVRDLKITVKAGIYRDMSSVGPGSNPENDAIGSEKKAIEQDEGRTVPEPEGQKDSRRRYFWKRNPINWSSTITIDKPGDIKKPVFPALSIRLRIRPPDKKGISALTLSLINENKKASSQSDLSEKSFFQVYFAVEGINGERPFVERRAYRGLSENPDAQSVLLLYRSVKLFAAGHGCSVDWKNEGDDRAGFIESSFIPRQPVFPFVSSGPFAPFKFSIKRIAESSPQELDALLFVLHKEYDKWIERQESDIRELPGELQETARRHISLCKETSSRIRAGIELLIRDPDVYSAFRLAHKAMLYHMAHSEWLKAGKPKEIPPRYDETHKWYPFQIAFLLQCLESLASPASVYRKTVDLLWFPTGGGKTEAYFGITALVLFLRRLRALNTGENGGGTAVLTRYTLRLLTLDQFYRAALLACSCEKVRKEEGEKLEKSAPISLGLWIGADASPNKIEDAMKALTELKSGAEILNSGDPTKLQECPWCGTKLGPADYSIESREKRMDVKCPSPTCYFHAGLPVVIVDEDVYRRRPSIVIGTVDKFARLPWLEETGYIFGCDRKDLPPDLIIQDELHLISGPLGTLVGLYETAVNLLCMRGEDAVPKIIASTATIKNAQNQIMALFNRQTRQFPQPVLDYRDSCFAQEDRTQPSRIYLGIFTPSLSPTTALVRAFADLLYAAKAKSAQDEIRDPYWTLMAYFLSLRELGGARRHIEDDVQDYLGFCCKRDTAKDGSTVYRNVNNVEELTSRVRSSELDDIREHLRTPYPSEYCLDVVLATNMISAGLDVPRLGLMAIVGQPKATSEYIQASSRIGRRYPGLVIEIFKWTQSRDRSHYERFKSYHSKLYSEVEATSVTPFSSRARERGLHAVLISLVRHLVPGMADNNAAARLIRNDPEVVHIVRYIEERVRAIDRAEFEKTSQDLAAILDKWEAMSRNTALLYSSSKGSNLLKSIESKDASGEAFPTLNSLRNVDQPAGVYLLKG